MEPAVGPIIGVRGVAENITGVAGAAGWAIGLNQVKMHFPRTRHFLLKGRKSMEWSSKCREQTPGNVQLLLGST